MELTDLERAVAAAGDARARKLASHGPQVLRDAGIVHTAPELARVLARLAEDALRQHLGLEPGLCSPGLQIIDPACGPGAFLAAVHAQARSRRQGAGVDSRVVGLDRDADAVARARELLSRSFEGDAWPLSLSATDSLAGDDPAGFVDAAAPVLVLGNPPWVSRAQPRPAPALDALLADFRVDAEGKPLGERKLGVLADAYVRFMRLGLELLCRSRQGGVLAFVTNGSYLDGPVHRGMRAMLLRSLDQIWIVDLGGSALLGREGGRDENVFGVRPSVAILIGMRTKEAADGARGSAGSLHYVRLRGRRDDKLSALADLRLSDFARLSPQPPLAVFAPVAKAQPGYASWPSLAEVCPFHAEGVQSNRDAVAIDKDPVRLLERVTAFVERRPHQELERAERALGHYDPERARRALAEVLELDPQGREGRILRPIAYRPFDTRYFVPVAPFCHRPRPRLLRAIDQSSFALLTVRKDRGERAWCHFAAVREVADSSYLSARSSCRTRIFPSKRPDGQDNVEQAYLAELERRVGSAELGPLGAEHVLHYALAVLACSDYRERHGGQLMQDYPRLPWPASPEEFLRKLSLGRRLVVAFCDSPPSEVLVRGLLQVGHHRLEASGQGEAGRRAAAVLAVLQG
ncbi:MAG: hypothetical protein OEZ06_26665 [Myxococcales bacterium]|nr:hypothetical protein [Myxococcales bacterium]